MRKTVHAQIDRPVPNAPKQDKMATRKEYEESKQYQSLRLMGDAAHSGREGWGRIVKSIVTEGLNVVGEKESHHRSNRLHSRKRFEPLWRGRDGVEGRSGVIGEAGWLGEKVKKR